jgi:hypothetical protein
MLWKEMLAACFEMNTKHRNTACGQKAVSVPRLAVHTETTVISVPRLVVYTETTVISVPRLVVHTETTVI